ncbi:thioredoxin domain-containing protein [Streptomyces actinomycinicus]|uniref:Thioredoxin domain-containing protein n=2 Tax=Streptomyces actinomycinicus TaxID=1695166 RepID=A0A937EQD3_9ACTN|nr:thioredoxin domain-containing protein [Streptomyces actinomycinicus]
MRRGFAAVVAVAVVGMPAAGCGGRDQSPHEAKDGGPAATARAVRAYAGLADAPERLGNDGTTIMVGDPAAPVTVHLYEDPRCPVCEEFESTGGGPELRAATLRREAKAQYTLASFLDGRLGGAGSVKAVNALRAALDEGKFAEYHEVLYANQPEESVDGFTDARLLELAKRVPGLRGHAFDSAVRTMKYRSFVALSEEAYEDAGGAQNPRGPGTPTAEINDVRIPAQYNGVLFDRKTFGGLLTEIRKDPETWRAMSP